MKRISFSPNDAQKLYELSLEHFQEWCPQCNNIKKRLEVFIGKKETAKTKRIIKGNGYCNK